MATGHDPFHEDEGDEVETIDPSLDLVSFTDVQTTYAAGEDIRLKYTLGRECRPSARDWVGLYPRQWTSTKDFVTYEWAPKSVQDETSPNQRCVLFKAHDIQVSPSAENLYQFLYITKHSQVIGVSTRFLINDVTSANIGRSMGSVTSLTSLPSVTSMGSASQKVSEQSFELVEEVSTESFEYLHDDCSMLYLDELFKGATPVTADLHIHPLHQSASSSYHLEWLFADTQETISANMEDAEKVYKKAVSAPKAESFSAEVFHRLRDICDWQWDEVLVEAVQTDRSHSEQAVMLYQPRDVIPYHTTDVVPFRHPGPVVLYEPPRPLTLFTHLESSANTTQNKEEVGESLLTPLVTRHYSKETQQYSDRRQVKLHFDHVLRELTRSFRQDTSVMSMSLVPTCKPHLLGITNVTIPSSSVTKVPKVKTKKGKCWKCLKKANLLKRSRKLSRSYRNKLTQLQKTVNEVEKDLALKTAVLEDLGRHVRLINVDNSQLREANAVLQKNVAANTEESRQEALNQNDWLEQCLHATQKDNLQLQNKCAGLKEEITHVTEESARREKETQMETDRRTARYLTTIAHQEKTIISITNNLNQVMKELEEGRRQRQQFQQLYEASCEMSQELSARITSLKSRMDEQCTRDEQRLKHVADERARRVQAERALQEQQELCEKRVSELQAALTAAQRLNQQNKTCQRCRDPLGACYPDHVKGRPGYQQVNTSSQTCVTETDCKTVQTSPATQQAAACPLPSVNCDSALNCDPAIVAVGGAARSSHCVTGSVWNDLTTMVPQQEQKTTTPLPSFFTSGLDFLSGISKTLTNTLTDEFLPPSMLDPPCVADEIGACTSAMPHAPAQGTSGASDAVNWSESVGSDAVNWSESVGSDAVNWSESLANDNVSWAESVEHEEKEVMMATNWMPDFAASWKPKGGRRRFDRAPGRGVRFDESAGPRDHHPARSGGRKHTNSQRGSAGYRWSSRRHLRKE